jgi:iron(II)-dependent oxidoreductase
MISSQQLIEDLTDARHRTLELVSDLTDEQLMGPQLDIINPLLWEIGHVAWFHEKWILRHLWNQEPVREDADYLYDSMAIAHDTRWDLLLPSRAGTLEYMQEVLDRIVECLDSREPEEDAYFYQLGLFHEDMHDEAFTYTRQTLEYPAPSLFSRPECEPSPTEPGGSLPGDVEVAGGTYLLGATRDSPFVFDNEKWAHPVELEPFQIARTAVTNAEYAAFVEAGGYQRQEWWNEEGEQWRQEGQVQHPVYWKRESSNLWLRRHFQQILPLEADLPVMHVNWFEAEAYCRWAGRRLPTEAEWEMAASTAFESDGTPEEKKRMYPWGDEPPGNAHANLDSTAKGCVNASTLGDGDSAVGCRQMIGNVWEWTASRVFPYKGVFFVALKDKT